MTNRLATALLAARREARSSEAGPAMEPWQFAVERLRLEGFDTTSWTPSPRIWKDAPGPGA